MTASAARTPDERTGAGMIAAERERQITAEGYTSEHDANHEVQIVRAAQCYSWSALRASAGISSAGTPPVAWPWGQEYWKPTGDPVRDLVKAGALIAAAIDSLNQEARS